VTPHLSATTLAFERYALRHVLIRIVAHDYHPLALLAMYAIDGKSSPSESGYTTPPLSPTKTISTEGWSSPRTPGSHHKSRSCLFFQDIGRKFDDSLITPPLSPTKPKFTARFSTLSTPEVLSPTLSPIPDIADDSPAKRDLPFLDGYSPRRSLNGARFSNRSSPVTIDRFGTTYQTSLRSFDSSSPLPNNKDLSKRRRGYRSSSDSSIEALVAKYTTAPTTPAELVTNSKQGSDRSTLLLGFEKLDRPSHRSSSSPLRPSQWVSRGGLLSSPRKSQTSIPDRFIHRRRPPAITRESFELNKPAEREHISQRGHRANGDPFSRRVRRSNRLSAELRGLREAHTVIVGRSIGNGRSANPRLRSSSLVTAARQISAGAIWNVGGVSAMSDTVTAVSTGNGTMLGSGTVAPLYTSAFLDRADPEAELEAYERRLALALDVDQMERILQHSPILSIQPGRKPNTTRFNKPHVWRDSIWTQDDARSRWFSELSYRKVKR